MIFLGFILLSSIFFIFAAISGNVFNFVNIDSLAILLVADLIFSIFTFKFKELVKGIKSMFAFNALAAEKDNNVAAHYKSLMVITLAVGVVSSMQGFISYALARRDAVESALNLPLMEALCYAGFSSVYAIILSLFLFYPTYIFNKEE